MPNYEERQSIFDKSLLELKAIASWLDDAEKEKKIPPVTVLIGGWAVYSYNKWYGSVDIDLVTNSDIKNRLMRHLIAERGFSRDTSTPPSTVAKYVNVGGIAQAIRLDFISRTRPYPFEGKERSCLNLKKIDNYSTLKEVEAGVIFRVPLRTPLLIYKLKAAWDRDYLLRSHRSPFPERDRSKLEKDYCDILALLDRGHYSDELDLDILIEELSDFDFLREIIRSLPGESKALARYAHLSHEDARSICENLLRLTKK